MRLLIALALALTLVALPAAAEDEPHITDECGDAVFSLRAGEDTMSSPDPYSPSFDIKAAWFTTVGSADAVEGVDLSMRLCGDAKEPEWFQYYAWHWTSEAGCRVALSVRRHLYIGPADVTQPVELHFTETCPTGEQILVFNEVRTTFEVSLDPAEVVHMDGDLLTVSLRADDLPDEALHAVAAGARWVEPFATTQMAFYRGTMHLLGEEDDVSLSMYSGSDRTAAGRDYVVGE